MSSFILNAICAFGVAVTAACVNRVTSGWNLDIVIISSLMPLVPGVATVSYTHLYERALELGTAAGSATAFQSWLASREDIVKLLDRPYSEYQI